MEELRQLGRTGIIADWVDNPPYDLGPEFVRGVALDVDEYWLSFWNAQRFHFPGHYPQLSRTFRTQYNIRYDFGQIPRDWQLYCRSRGYPENAHPVRVIVSLRDPPPVGKPIDRPVSIGPHPIIYEVRSEAIAQVAAASYIAKSGAPASKYGTVGGILYNQADLSFHAVTCAHVILSNAIGDRLISPRPTIFGNAVEVGRVLYNDYPSPSPGGKCNNKISAVVPKLDAALAIIDGTVIINVSGGAGKISKVSNIADLGKDDDVVFHGATSGKVEGKIAEVNIWHELDVEGTKTCFSDLFAIKSRVTTYISTSLSKPGDSGAWIVNSQAGINSWDGMLIGGDDTRSYCCYAEHVFQAFQVYEPKLILPP